MISFNPKDKVLYYNGNEALAFSDVYLLPSFSDIESRFGRQINTSTVIANGAPKLNLPIISAGMDTVTEHKMAEILALNGGIGEVHRNNTPEYQSELVKLVKERVRIIETNPPIVGEGATIAQVKSLLSKRNRGYVLICRGEKSDGYILGIATDKDFLAGDPDTKIVEVMTPLTGGRKRLITAPKGTTLIEAVEIMKKERIEKLPILDKDGKLFGVYTLKDYQFMQSYPNAATDERGRLIVGAAIGVHEIDVERALMLVKAEVDVLFLDIAHGHSVHTSRMLKRLKIREKIKTPIIVGNIATKEASKFACEIGADGVKVGIGPGFVCRTRNVAGTGVPQISALLEVYQEMSRRRSKIPIISDGGIREPGDVPKALACGADAVMIGSLFAGTDMSPGDLVRINGILQKRVRGMASMGALEDRKKLSDSTTNILTYAPEGRETYTPFQGSTQEVLYEYISGLRSGMSYVGAHSINELKKARLIHVSHYGSSEQIRPLG